MSLNKPPADEAPPRIRTFRGRWALPAAWLGSRAAVAAVAGLTAAFLLGMGFLLRDRGSFSRRHIEFPPVPQLDAAIVAAQERLKENPQDINALVEVGTLHFEKGKDFYPDAINELEEARELGALDPRLFYCLGIMYQEVGLYRFALQEYRRFLRHYPDDKEVRMLAAKLLYREGSFSEAVSEYERLKFHHPNDPLIEENLALSLWGAKETDRALESFNTLKSRGGDAARRAEFYLGQIFLEEQRYEEAVEHLERSIPTEGEPGTGIAPEQVYSSLGAAFQKLSRLPEAKAAWEEVLKAVPGDSKAQASLRDINRRLPRPKKK